MTPDDEEFFGPWGEDPDDFDDDELSAEDHAAVVTWDTAVAHAEFAADLQERAAILMTSIRAQDADLTILLSRMAREHQLMAGALLAAGGYGDDELAHRSLGLPWIGNDPAPGGSDERF